MSTRAEINERIQVGMQYLIAGVVLTNERVARKMGLLTVDVQTLHLISLAPSPMTAGEIAKTTSLPTSTVTRIIDRLEEKGFVERVPSPDDRRKTLVAPIRKRVAEIGKNYDRYSAMMTEINATFTMEQLEAISQYFAQLAERGIEQGSTDAEESH